MDKDKKSERKTKRFVARLKSSKGLRCSEAPRKNIVLCNVGQATGFVKEDVISLLKERKISVPKYIAKKGESHSFLVFDTTEDALWFSNTFNGKVKINENVLFMNFVDNVPINDILCADENPKGLTLLHDFISIEEEILFLKLFDCNPDSQNLKNRQVHHFGYEFKYGSNDVDLNNPLDEKIPTECDILWERLKAQGIDVGVPDQLTVNKYCPGQGIPSHVDKHSPFKETILSLSLGSDVVMDWKHRSGKYVPIVIKARSLLVMQDEARYDWQHGIQSRLWDPVIVDRTENLQNMRFITHDTVARNTRISLTFRWTRSGPCECVYKTLCDSVSKPASDDLEDQLASNLEELHVHRVYEQIASHFSTTRHKPWPKVIQFMEDVTPGSIVLDLGCGNGKNILRRNDLVQIAGERSSGLLTECKKHISGISGADCVRLDLLNSLLKDETADVVICIAVIHHFSSKARRLQAVSTIQRLLRKDGRALITVWAKDQTKSNYLCKNKEDQHKEVETQVTVGGVNLPVHENRTQFKHKDLLVPWKLRKIKENKIANQPEDTLFRYYHVFEENELDALCNEANMIVEDSFYEEGNWCVVCKKK